MTTEMQTYPASAVVNYFLDNAQKYGVIITPMKLQKMLYFANGWAWAFYDKPLISDECKAWQFGPVYHEVYHEYKDLGSREIPSDKKMLYFDRDDKEYKIRVEIRKAEGRNIMFAAPPEIEKNISEEDKLSIDLLDNIMKSYGKKDGLALSNWTHVDSDDNPWSKARKECKLESPTISNDDIIKYFKRLKKQGTLK